MAILRTDIERALDELASQEEGMRFQGLAVVLGKMRWPELIARQRKKDLGLDAYASASLTPDKVGKGLAASITATLRKISADARAAKESFPDLGTLLFVTSAKVGNADQQRWKEALRTKHGLELHIIEREEIISLMLMPENASLRAGFLHLETDAGPRVAELIERIRRAADVVTHTWSVRTKGYPLIELTAVRLDPKGSQSADVLSLEQIDEALSLSRRVVLEGPAGAGKTTTLIQLAQRPRSGGIPFIIDLPNWVAERKGILEFIAGMPAFQAEGLSAADLAFVQQTVPFLFMLNGWNEIAESRSSDATTALSALARDFPSAGIIVATRVQHSSPPPDDALRLRLLRLQRVQRTNYLAARLGAKAAELRIRIEADRSLDELTRTPFILSEVASLFEADVDIPHTKIDVLAEVLRLQERRDEHSNALQAAPLFGLQTDYLKALATEMTCRGAVQLLDAEARSVVAAVARGLEHRGQAEPVGAPAILATLTAHHVLERVDYPHTAFQFEHQQFQEYYAALDVRAQLLALQDDDSDGTCRFTADYVNDPAWAEPLRMIAEVLAEPTGDSGSDTRNIGAGARLVRMALAVDLVFAGELAQLCGAAVWVEVREAVSDRFRSASMKRDANYQQIAQAAMLATGVADFSDMIVPLLSGQDQQTRLRTYRLWPDFQLSSLGPTWREEVRRWSAEARADFVSELLLHRHLDGEVAAFAAEDIDISVKKAAADALIWTGAEDALACVLESMDPQAFEDVARENGDLMPAAFRPATIAAMHRFIKTTGDHPGRLRTALDLIELGETELDGVVKDAIAALPSGDMSKLGSHYIEPALRYLRKADPVWMSEWVATQVAEGTLYDPEHWLPFATAVPAALVQAHLQRLETEDFKNRQIGGMIAVVAAGADVSLAERVFVKLRELRREADAESTVPHELEWQLVRQLEAVFRRLPDDIAAAGILSSVTTGDPLDITVATGLMSRVARADGEPLRVADEDLRARLRAYLKSSEDVVLQRDDFTGVEKANLASSIAQVGGPGDMVDLRTLIQADIARIRRGRAALVAGDRGPLGNGGYISYAAWHIASALHLDRGGSEQLLIDLLSEPEYRSYAAAAMAQEFIPKPERRFDATFRHDVMWAAREHRTPPSADTPRRSRFASALVAGIKRLHEQAHDGRSAAGLKELAKALAAIDGQGSAAAVLEATAVPGRWDEYTCLDAAERLLMAGVILPAPTAFALVDSILARTEKWMQDSDKSLLVRILGLCLFVDDPAAGIGKIREVLGRRRFYGYELRELITALGESRFDGAVDLLYDLASDAHTFEQCEDIFINAVAALDTLRARELLLGFVDPDIRGIPLPPRHHREDVLVARLAELAKRRPEVAERLRVLCERDLPELNRQILSRVMDWIRTPGDVAASLNLIDDAKPSPIPRGIWDQLEAAFVERRPDGDIRDAFTEHARASNELRRRLFEMLNDDRRRKSAFRLLGQIEQWRLEHGRPFGEPRHPAFGASRQWPPLDIVV